MNPAASPLLHPENNIIPPAHLGYLDSARGIAAWMVALLHFINWRYDETPGAEWTFFLINGREAVSFFFVLSGFVLAYKYLQLGRRLDLRTFYLNRFFRLFPAYFITVLINFLYAHRADLSATAVGDLFLRNTGGFWEEALLIRRHSHYFPPGWTLNAELCASLLLPFAITLYTVRKGLVKWLIFFCILTGNSIVQIVFLHFLLGMLLAGNFGHLHGSALKSRKIYRYKYPILAAALLLYSLRQIDRVSPLGPTLVYVLDYLDFDFFFFSGIASTVFLVWLFSTPMLQRLLSGSVFQFCGKISYGIYLTHWAVGQVLFDSWDNFWVVRLPNEPVRLATVLAIGIAATVVLATLLYYLVERPMIHWGKKLSRRWALAEQNIPHQT